jgi:anti-anti-sigma factor
MVVAATVGFRVDVEHEPHGARVCPVGEVDVATIGHLREQLEELIAARIGRVILDLRQTTFLDSTGLRLAAEAHRSATANGTEFALLAGPPAVQRAFVVTGLGERLPFVEPPRP